SCHKTPDLEVNPTTLGHSGETASLITQDPIPIQPDDDPFSALAGYPTPLLPSLSESEKLLANQNIIINSASYLKTTYGFTDAEFIQHFGSVDAPEVGYLGIVLLALEQAPPITITPSNGGCLGVTEKVYV